MREKLWGQSGTKSSDYRRQPVGTVVRRGATGQTRVDDQDGRLEPSTAKVGLGYMEMKHRLGTRTSLSGGPGTPQP